MARSQWENDPLWNVVATRSSVSIDAQRHLSVSVGFVSVQKAHATHCIPKAKKHFAAVFWIELGVQTDAEEKAPSLKASLGQEKSRFRISSQDLVQLRLKLPSRECLSPLLLLIVSKRP